MDGLRRMTIFFHVVETQSFSAAALKLGIARSAVSRHITLLERSVGVRLLNRTTRSLSLTEAGQVYYRSCARIVEEAETAMQRMEQLRDEPTGSLKVAGSVCFGAELAQLVARFTQRYTALSVELLLDDEVVDMVREGIDVSIRIGWLHDSALVARKLCDSPRLLCASPDYIERRCRPDSPGALNAHECIIFTLLPDPLSLDLQQEQPSTERSGEGPAKDQQCHRGTRFAAGRRQNSRTVQVSGPGRYEGRPADPAAARLRVWQCRHIGRLPGPSLSAGQGAPVYRLSGPAAANPCLNRPDPNPHLRW